MKKVLFATSNISKVNRFQEKLKERGIELISLKDLNLSLEVEENGKDAVENAVLKAREAYKITKMPVIAMDDNLYLENVSNENQPGLFVRRVNGKVLNDAEMIEHYTNLVKQFGRDGHLNSKWVYGLCCIDKEGNINTYSWEKDGFYLVEKPSLKINPGYPLNSISKYKKIDKYFTDVTEDDLLKVQVNEDHVVDFICRHV